ncbi:MAG: glycosyltransferase family 4 protein [Bacteroidetes bacterium]|nr:glycosyltransferase family 4 protein [Bacteroidota bacterium]
MYYNQRLKICHIGWATSIHVERLMRWFAKKGHDISIITNNQKDIPGVKVLDIKRKPDNRPRWDRYKDLNFNIGWVQNIHQIARIRKLVNKISPDIVHSHSLWYPGYLGVYISGYPFVVTVLNGDVLWTKKDIGRKLSIYEKYRTKKALRKADLVTGESEVLINAAIKNGVSSNKVFVSKNYGVDLTKFNCNGNKTEIRREISLPVDCKIVLSPRNTGSFYNLDKIVKAIPMVINKAKNTYFVFIWHGHNSDKEKELTNLVSKLGVDENIKIVGFVNHDKVALYHKASDVMVSVSKYDSGPVALQEAMACGDVPVISNLPSVREWVKDGWNGILVDPNNVDQIADSIIRLLENDQMRESFAERNWKLIREKGDQEYWMGKMEELYYQLIEERQ